MDISHHRTRTFKPDGIVELILEDRRIPYFLKYEHTARYPAGFIQRLAPYKSYYESLLRSGTCHHSHTPCSRWTPETVADTYVHTAARMRLRLAILVSSKQILSETGFLEPSWNRLWEPTSPRARLSDLAGYTWSLLHWWMERKRRYETVSFTISSTWTWRGFVRGDWRSVYAVAGRSTAVHSGRFSYEMALTRQAGPGKPAGFGRNLGLKSGHGRPRLFSGVPGR